MHEKLGKAVMVVFEECVVPILNNAESLKLALDSACRRGGATVLNCLAHQFWLADNSAPDGATALVALAESHAAAHSWPRRTKGTLVVTVYTCGNIDPVVIARLIGRNVGAKRLKISEVDFDALASDNTPWLSGDS